MSFLRRADQHAIAATPADLNSNRLGLLSQAQLGALHEQLAGFQTRAAQFLRRTVLVSLGLTIGVVALTFVRVLALPIALGLEALLVGVMLYFAADCNRFVQALELDREAQTVRIVKGRTSRHALRVHPFYSTMRVELQSYKLLDAGLARQFTTGALYQFYVLPHTQLIVAAESIDETGGAFFR
ncbi:MAG: hypothetical protein OXG92_00510 [Chloroflexi bacterium]|nr:hypothetical protein [Chloroflexota bacterium]MCY3583013.1 hypothetical protein [Chloroflexota bacterium]MCY3714936.1 hypothetical protein [Chloroflexota bacterium]MDE2651049.1 hypothetical protein [Chloroflexota bacterium]MXX50797.1 hypothetical protein [Chloroflexota bacterium]